MIIAFAGVKMVKQWILPVLMVCGSCFAGFNGDLNNDRGVDLGDLAVLGEYWLDHGNAGCNGDTGNDCRVDAADLAKLSEQWLWMECISTATASGVEDSAYAASKAIDGSMSTRWSSAFANNQWLQIDLGRVRTAYGLKIYWEAAYATSYNVQVSVNGSTWTQVYADGNANGGTDDINFTQRSVRYVKINCLTRATTYGSSIYEVQIKSNDDCRPASADWELVWSDEFDGPSISTANWSWETGGGGWGNNEWQYYTNSTENSSISDGKLVITARKNHLGRDYTSARMVTRNKRSFQYGRMEARIKLPVGGKGIWPAYWMLGNNIGSHGWPECGELDILEAVNDFVTVHGTLHYGSGDPYIHDSNGGSYTPPVDVSADYHVYAVEWEPTVMRWYFDDVKFYTTSNWWASTAYPAPFNQPFFFILNIAVGGNWPGYPDATTTFPQTMYVDYIRVYQDTNP